MGKIKKYIYLIITSLILISVTSSCRYEEGPIFSFTKVENRIRGIWQIVEIQKNGITTYEPASNEEQIDSRLEFYQSRNFIIHYIDGLNLRNGDGTWEFDDKKRNLIVNYKGKKNTISRIYKIIKFKNNELKLSFTDANDITWTLKLDIVESFIAYGL